MDLLWRKAPLVLLRFPGLFAAIATAALLLALATASGPLFVSAATSSALTDELEDATRFGAGASIVYQGRGARLDPAEADANRGIDRLNEALLPGLRGVAHVEAPVLTVLGTTVTPGTAPGPTSERPLRLLAKTGALAHVVKVAGRDGDGVWIADEAAESMRLQPGDDLYLNYDDGATRTVSIDGIYRALWKEPRTPYWRSLSHFIYAADPDAGPPPTFLIGGRTQVVALSRAPTGLQLRWEWPLDGTHLTLDEADALERRLQLFQQRMEELATRLRAGTSGFRAPQVSYSSLLPIVISTAKERAATLRGPADLLAAAAVLVALAVVGAAAAFGLARRRVEAAVLFARGAAPGEIGGRAAVEALLPILVGSLVGFGLAVALTAVVGPGAVARSALAFAAAATGLAMPIAALLIGLVSALVFASSSERRSARSLLTGRLPWEIVVLVAAAFFLYELRTKGGFAGGEAQPARPSLSVILFPLFFLAGVSGLAARGSKRAFAALRAAGTRFPAAPYLAVRRLAAAERLTLLLATASAVSLGAFVYAQAVARSLEETVEAKSLLFVGSDVNGLSDYNRQVPGDFPLPATMVSKLVEGGKLDGSPVDIMVIDVKTFASAAYFDESWANEPVDQIVPRLERAQGDRLPVVLAGHGSATASLELGAEVIPIEVVEKTRAFPGMSLRRPLVVADRAMFERAVAQANAPNPLASAAAETQIWVRGETSRAVRALQSSNLRPFPIVTAEQVRENPTIRSVTQTFSYLESLGLAAGLLALAGAVLYLQARYRTRVISYALARRMGLAAGKHRLALGLELGTLLIFSFTVGAFLAVLAARIVIVELDAPAELPAGPLFRTPWALMGAALLGLIGASATGALIADRRARRANLAEVIRAGE